jgi:hypothetical protein
MLRALVMNSKPFSTLPIIHSPFPIVMTKALSPLSRAKPLVFGLWRWILINPAQFHVIMLIPIFTGLV